MNYKPVIFWSILWITFITLLQYFFKYHLFYIEQTQLFLFDSDYLSGRLFLPGGFSLLAAEFFTQFFLQSYGGPVIVASLLVLAGINCRFLIRSLAPQSHWFLFDLLPVLPLFFVQLDFNYRLQGTVAFLLTVFLLNLYVRIKSLNRRLSWGICFVLLLFGLTGADAMLFAGMACLIELLRCERRGWYALLLPVIAALAGLLAVRTGAMGEFRFAFSPALYYHDGLLPKPILYLTWVALPVAVTAAFLLDKLVHVSRKAWQALLCLLQLVVIVLLLFWGVPHYGDFNALRVKALDYFARNGQWDNSIALCQGKLTNYIDINQLNMALANKGILAERMFFFDQRNLQGLIIPWNKTENISVLLSDIYYTAGAVALSQQMAFEAYVSSIENANPRMLKRLVQTNLILGEYAVAEKYLDLLDKTYSYSDWSEAQRRFLYRDDLLMQDEEYALKRNSLPLQNRLAQTQGIVADFEQLIEANPQNKAAMHYLGASYLLAKDLRGFQDFLARYYGTEAMPVLPLHFQEAVLILTEEDPEIINRFPVSGQVKMRFADYKTQTLANRGQADLQQILYKSFGNSYWYFYMFKS